MKEITSWTDFKIFCKSHKHLSSDAELFLIDKLKTERDKALELLIKYNISNAHYVIIRYRWCNIPYEDLLQYAVEGIIIAADNYKPDKNTKFLTYATHYIIGRVRQALEKYNHIIRKPAHINLAAYQISKLGDVEITDEQLHNISNDRYKFRHLKLAQDLKQQTISNIDDFKHIPYTQKDNEAKLSIESLLENLSDLERKVIKMKFGFLNKTIYTYKEIDLELGINSENVIINALKKLKSLASEDDFIGLLK
jgi:RNA polymerase primary sigma factor